MTDEIKMDEMIQEAEAVTEETAQVAQQVIQPEVPMAEVTVADAVTVPELKLEGIETTGTELSNQLTTTNMEPFDKDKFTPEELAKIDEFAATIDLTNSNQILQYGASAQNNATQFCEAALQGMRTKELGEMQSLLTNMTVQVRGFEEEKKGLFGLFKKSQNKVETMKAKYATIDANLDKVEESLQGHNFELLKDIATLDKLYDQNKAYFKELSMYIAAGKKRLEEVRSTDLVALQQKAQETKDPEDAQAANDLAAMCNRFEKKIYDLELTRMVTLQSAPQIRTVQDANIRTSEALQSTIANTIPLWKREMVMAISSAHSLEAAKAQQMVADATNEMLEKNAEQLQEAAVTAAKEYERGIIDMETIRHNNDVLVKTIEEILAIQEEGQQKRRAAEAELSQLESDLKAKLLEASAGANDANAKPLDW